MATSRGNHYEGGEFGTGGKFRKRPFRRAQTTPYDWPTAALRNPRRNSGWFSKLVDPAQRLITSGAHMLFSTVFRKRLLPPPPPSSLQPLSSDPEQGGRENCQEVAGFAREVSVGKQKGASGESEIQMNSSERDGFSELEKLLKQKTFTRSEVNHLTALLDSKVMDSSIGEEKRTEVVPSEPVLLYKQKEDFLKPSALENGIENRLVSTPFISSSVLDGDVASPAELAKAYMGSKPFKVSPMSSQIPARREDPTFLNSQHFPPKSPTMSIASRITGQLRAPENGLVTPRSRGRSAIYSMARTPYARVYPTSTVMGVGLAVEAGPSSSSAQLALDHGRISARKFGVGKHRISVLDNDIGSVGPIRRVRQKSNVLSLSGLSISASGSPVSITRSIHADDAQLPSSFIQKPLGLGEAKNKILKLSAENVDGPLCSTSSTPLPSKSCEMASRILQQLDKMVFPKEKSPELKLTALNDKSPRLSPSMLHRQALQSIETVDSSKFLHCAPDNKLDGLLKNLSADAQKLTSEDDYKVGNGSLKSFAPSGGLVPVVTDGAKFGDNSIAKCVSLSPQKKRAFHMRAHEDYLEVDDDRHPNRTVSSLSTAGKEKTDFTAVTRNTTSAPETILPEKASPSSIVNLSRSSKLDNKAFVERADASLVDGKISASTSITTSSSSLTFKPVSVTAATQSNLSSDICAPANESIAAPPLFAFGNKKLAPLTESPAAMPLVSSLEKVDSSKESVADASLFNFGNNKNVDTVPQMSSSSVDDKSFGYKFGASESKLGSSISATVSAGANDLMLKTPQSRDAEAKANKDIGFSVISSEPAVLSAAPTSFSTSATSMFAFGHNSNQNNGPSTSSLPFSSPLSVLSNDFTSSSLFSGSSLASSRSKNATCATAGASMFTSTPAVTASTENSSSTSIEALSSYSISFFKFGSLPITSTDLPISSSVGSEPAETNSQQDAGFGNINRPAISCKSASCGSSGSGIFGFSSLAMTTVNQSMSPGFGSSIGPGLGTQASPTATGFTTTESQSIQFGVQASAAATGFGNSTRSQSIQFGSSASYPFGASMNVTFSSGSSIFASSSPTTIVSSGMTVGFSTPASSSVGNSVISNGGTTSSFPGLSGWQPSKSPFDSSFNSFASTFNSSSSGFSFGASGTPVSSDSSPMAFSFASTAANTSVQPVFSSPNPVFAFNSAQSTNNDQMGMEDSMAEDTVQATPPAQVFGQPPTPPQSNFVFGATAPSGASPLQFGSQQNIASQNSSPFQASGSLEFNAGGSFSLGAGGGDKSNRKYVRVKHKQRKS